MELLIAEDHRKVEELYGEVIEKTPDIARYARWEYGRHPTDEAIEAYIASGEMYLLVRGEEVLGMTALVMHQNEEYENISWEKPLDNDQAATLHLLCVCPGHQGRGLGAVLLEKAEELARKTGKKSMRLDVLESNLPARQMYEKAGYSYRGRQHLYAENTGWTDFLYYEKNLEQRRADTEGKYDSTE